MKSITVKIEGLPPSYNEHFKINYSFKEVYLSQEARDYKKRVKVSMPVMEVTEEDKLRITIMYNHNWHYQNGKIRKKDVQNLDKLLIDAICEKLGCDDSQAFEIHLYKIQSNNSFTVINIETI